MAVAAILRRLLPDVEGREFVYPQRITGRYQRLRAIIGWTLIAILVVTPFVRIGGMPAILLDIPHRRFILFGRVFWPQDVWLLVFVLLAVVIGIVLFTAVWGRVWCGYACPQSVFLGQVFLRIERWIEGDRNQQMRLDRAPWTWGKLRKKLLKHALFLAVSSFVAHIFLAYFIEVKELASAILHPSWTYRTPILFATLFTVAFYVDFAFLREQFCNYLCPYARFQSALLDEESLIVAYDHNRGEPRANMRRRKQAPEQRFGDCIDCTKCVVVCPQGIDIRNGLQLECIHCAACIDACDSVMEKIGRPRGLIRYASEAELEGRPARGWRRPRVLAYSVLLLVVTGFLAYELATRRLVEATLVRPPGELYRVAADGWIYNRFQLQLVNKDLAPRSVEVVLMAPSSGKVVTPHNPRTVAPGSVVENELFVGIPPTRVQGGQVPFRLEVRAGGERLELSGKLIVPEESG